MMRAAVKQQDVQRHQPDHGPAVIRWASNRAACARRPNRSSGRKRYQQLSIDCDRRYGSSSAPGALLPGAAHIKIIARKKVSGAMCHAPLASLDHRSRFARGPTIRGCHVSMCHVVRRVADLPSPATGCRPSDGTRLSKGDRPQRYSPCIFKYSTPASVICQVPLTDCPLINPSFFKVLRTQPAVLRHRTS